jgi:hypothetical protein
MRGVVGESIRYPVDPRDVPASKAARRLHLTLREFEEVSDQLYARGFPRPDPTTGNFDLVEIDRWMDGRHHPDTNKPRDARDVVKRRWGD